MRRTLALLLTVLVPMIADPAAAAELTGTATYRQRIATPPGTRFEAVLLDVSRADAPSVEIGRFDRAEAGNPPYAFAIPYDPATIDPTASYAVRASLILPEGRLFFTTDTHVPVLTRGAPARADIVLAQAGGGGEGVAPAEPPTLVGPRWALVEIGGAPAPEGATAHLVFDGDGRIAGDGGCNRLGAGYVARGDGAFLAGEAFSTMMACPEPAMTTERAVHAALRDARAWRIEGDLLILAAADGTPLARFRAGPPQ